MDRRFEENSARRMLVALQDLTNRQLSDEEIAKLAHGASEQDIVESGLEDTMITSYNQINDIKNEFDIDLRTAAFISAIRKIAVIYNKMGIFP